MTKFKKNNNINSLWIQLFQERNPEKVEEKARMIYEEYVSILSPREVESVDS